MTSQIPNKIRFRDAKYAIAETSGYNDRPFAGPLDLSSLGIQPASTWTCCWRGYQAFFAVTNSQLILEKLYTNSTRRAQTREGVPLLRRVALRLGLLSQSPGQKEQEAPPIGGVPPSPSDARTNVYFDILYDRLHHHIEFSGGLLLVDGFVDCFRRSGFPYDPPWKYVKVMELIFDAGNLTREYDRSEQMANLREAVLDSYATTDSRQTDRIATIADVAPSSELELERTYPAQELFW